MVLAGRSSGNTALRVGPSHFFLAVYDHLSVYSYSCSFFLSIGTLQFSLSPVLSIFLPCLPGELLLVIQYPTQMSALYGTFPGCSWMELLETSLCFLSTWCILSSQHYPLNVCHPVQAVCTLRADPCLIHLRILSCSTGLV